MSIAKNPVMMLAFFALVVSVYGAGLNWSCPGDHSALLQQRAHHMGNESAGCFNGEDSGCSGGQACGRYNSGWMAYSCCSSFRIYNGVAWCANGDGGACSNGESRNCQNGFCGRYNSNPDNFMCCTGKNYNGVAWCGNPLGGKCSDGESRNCAAGGCGRYNNDATAYQCCYGNTIGGIWWCQSADGGLCSDGEDRNCASGRCNRYNNNKNQYKCCSASRSKVSSGISWCTLPPNSPCEDGNDAVCPGSQACGRNISSSTGFTCCSDAIILFGGNAVCKNPTTITRHPDAPIYQTPFLMTHDSATAYLGQGGFLRLEKYLNLDFAKTQTISLPDQLSCGARALDIRPAVMQGNYNDIRFYHTNGGKLSSLGGYSIAGFGWYSKDQSVSNTMPLIKSWAQAHPSELVILLLANCFNVPQKALSDPFQAWDSINCNDAQLMDAFSKTGLKVSTDCDKINKMTLKQVEDYARLEGGGMVLVLPGQNDCTIGNWKEAIDTPELVIPYMMNTAHTARQWQNMYQIQAFPQANVKKLHWTIADPTVNHAILPMLTQTNELNPTNFVEVDFVCVKGPELARALGTNVNAADSAQCTASCQKACEIYKC
jgi:hypothetical protein